MKSLKCRVQPETESLKAETTEITENVSRLRVLITEPKIESLQAKKPETESLKADKTEITENKTRLKVESAQN